jgi:hypothetical protein
MSSDAVQWLLRAALVCLACTKLVGEPGVVVCGWQRRHQQQRKEQEQQQHRRQQQLGAVL